MIASLLAMEMILHYDQVGMTLFDRLEELYQIHGYYLEDLISLSRQGKSGMEEIGRMMAHGRNADVGTIGGISLSHAIDYQAEGTGLPKSDVLKFFLEDGSWFAVRPFWNGAKTQSVHWCQISNDGRVYFKDRQALRKTL